MKGLSMNRRELIKTLAVLAAGASGSLVVGGQRRVFAADSHNKVLRVQNDLDITNLDPANRSGWYDEMVMFAIYSGLCQYKPGTEWGWQLDAAQSLEQVDPLTIRFALRPGIQWTGGFGEMTAEDVKYSYERFLNKELAAIYASDWEALEATQDKKIGTASAACSGHYKIGDWQPRERLTLVRNEGWNGRRSEYDQIQLVPIGDLNTVQIAFEAGDLDMTKINISAIGKYRDDPGDNL
ncbi:ABC transporter substrate-binding protein [Sodalis glossinidius]|uniref:ABC transporter substrate-binding protein n=1 Tax=Sodalis glossinidius TaxID=63612 RepID=UPI002436E78C|nr:ABC transporter substrate-binding protein [Sodalis glossinidius]